MFPFQKLFQAPSQEMMRTVMMTMKTRKRLVGIQIESWGTTGTSFSVSSWLLTAIWRPLWGNRGTLPLQYFVGKLTKTLHHILSHPGLFRSTKLDNCQLACLKTMGCHYETISYLSTFHHSVLWKNMGYISILCIVKVKDQRDPKNEGFGIRVCGWV